MSLFFDVLLTFFLFALFGISHTILASRNLKQKIAEQAGDKIAFYRLFYNISSFILFLAVFALSPKPDVIIYDLHYPVDMIVFGIQVASLFALIISAKYIDVAEFIGIAQIQRYFSGKYNAAELDENTTLKYEGMLKYSRHPIYFFSILIISFRPSMNLFDLLLCITLTIYFIIGAKFEERKLVDKFGESYVKYQKEVPMFVPLKFFKRNKAI